MLLPDVPVVVPVLSVSVCAGDDVPVPVDVSVRQFAGWLVDSFVLPVSVLC
jgi:hypothetical protein